MYMDENIYVAMAGDKRLYLNPAMANRHGLIAGATGTGKTVTMKVMAESFSDMGVPVFMADVKGDVSGLAEPGENNEGMQKLRVGKHLPIHLLPCSFLGHLRSKRDPGAGHYFRYGACAFGQTSGFDGGAVRGAAYCFPCGR